MTEEWLKNKFSKTDMVMNKKELFEFIKTLEQRLKVSKLYNESVFITIPELEKVINELKAKIDDETM